MSAHELKTEVSAFQQRLWAAQRVGWVVMAVLIVLAGLGAAGGAGPLNETTVASSDGSLKVSYARIQRAETETDIEWTVMPRDRRQVTLDLDSAFRSAFSVEHMEPEPERVELAADHQRLFFRSVTGDSVQVRTSVRARRVGRMAVGTRVNDGEWLRLSMFALP